MASVYVTKHALTSGIQERTLKSINENGKMIEVTPLSGEYGLILIWKPYWHLTREEAILHAEEMRKKKIVSLRRQIAKMEKLKFNGAAT